MTISCYITKPIIDLKSLFFHLSVRRYIVNCGHLGKWPLGNDCHGGKIHHWNHNDDVIYWKHFPRYWPFVRGFHRSPMNSPPKGQWRGALMFSLICAWINGWVNNREAGDLRRHRAHYDATVIIMAMRLRDLQNTISFQMQLSLILH